MKVLQVARYGSIRGGAETYVAAASSGLREAGHDVALAYGIEPDDSREEVRAGAQVPGLAEPGAARDEAVGALRAVIEAFSPDVVHVHLPDVAWVAPLAATLVPTLLAVHDHRLNCPTGTKYWAFQHRACTVKPGVWCLGYNVGAHCGSLRANATLKPYRHWSAAREAAEPLRTQVFSHYMAGMLASAGLDATKIGVTHYPVPAMAAPGSVPVGDRRPVIFATGRLNKEKGFGQLIDAMARVRAPSHLVIAGEGHERAALERRARGTVGPHRITFTGWITGAELSGWYQQASIVCVPSMWPEPFGIVGLEAMAAGKPVVAFDSGGIPEWLADGETGRLVPTGDVVALAQALTQLLQDPDEQARMGAAGAARAESEFSLARHITALTALYDDVRRA